MLANYGVPVFPMGSVGNVFFVGLFAYAAARYRLMDVDVVIMRAAGAVLACVAVVLPLTGAIIWAQTAVFGASHRIVTGTFLLGIVVSVTAFSRLRIFVEHRVERSLFPARLAARKAIERFSHDVVQLPRPRDLGSQLTAVLFECLRVNGVALFLSPTGKDTLYIDSVHGSIFAPPQVDNALFSTPPKHKDDAPLVMPIPPRLEKLAPPTVRAEHRWETCVALRASASSLGYIVLTPKSSAAAFDDSDVVLLTTLATQLAVALKNNEYVTEIERQNAALEELQHRVSAENIVLREEVRSSSPFREIIGSSKTLQRALVTVEKTAVSDVSILITGETGTGKELVARAVHELSHRRQASLISVNCPAIPRDLAESELFGHERGAFTSAVEAKPGKFELANGGTLFLDEIAELPLELQVKLLRVLQEREVQRVGSTRTRKVDLRVVAATNRDLQAEMRAGRFREDLFFRLATVTVHVPALRERIDDIPVLASFFLDRALAAGEKHVEGFSPEALSLLCRYNWPGNIRELQNVIERAVLLCSGEVIHPEHLSLDAGGSTFGATIQQEKARRMLQALAQTDGNQAAAARLLGMSRSNFGRLMKSLGLRAVRSIHPVQ